ncbi:MAG: homocysteine S-methyltransferase family protein [Clostridia bacterium]|nr:homocysteine S-methyltransferase family protein [Clostridia bacterium]
MSFRSTFYRWPKDFPIPFILDGGTGTSLQARGMPSGVCTETWVDAHPEMIRDVQREFISAGSDAVNSPNFGGSSFSLSRHGVKPGEIPALNARLAGYSRAEADGSDRRVYVSGDIGPCGRFLEPYGDTPFDDVFDSIAQQAEAMDKYVDFWLVETQISLAEARCAVLAVKSVSQKPVFVTMTLADNGRTMSGETPLCCLLALADAGAAAFGFNCSEGPEIIYNSLRPLVPYAASLGAALIAKPNAGRPIENPDGSRTFSMDPDTYAGWMKKIMDLGVCVLGGCCGTDGRYISKIKELSRQIDPEAIEIAPENAENIACTGSMTAEIPDDAADSAADVSSIDDFDDFADSVEEDYAALRVENMDDAENVIENLMSLTMPLCLTGDKAVADAVRRVYNGKIVYLG